MSLTPPPAAGRPAAGRPAEAVSELARVPAAPAPVDPAEDGLHVCPVCRGGLVQPRDWRDAGPDHWLVDRFCPDCWWSAEERHAQDVMEAFDLVLDGGTDVLLRSLHRLTAERMQEDVERFAAALRAGALLPEDF